MKLDWQVRLTNAHHDKALVNMVIDLVLLSGTFFTVFLCMLLPVNIQMV